MNKTTNKKFLYKSDEKDINVLKNINILPSISDYPSRTDWENVCWQKILESTEMLQLFITFRERRNIIMRVAALNRLVAGQSFRQISDELWLSTQTISGIKKVLKEKNYRSYFERSKKERKRKKYSSDQKSFKPRPAGIPRRTKFGTIYMP